MTSLLRRIVAGPRAPHPEANLDLCYVTDNIIATSGPSATYPSRAYRNPLDALVKFLDEKHGDNWCIWEFRAEGTGYPDEAVKGRVRHFPWPDHHPPPFVLLPAIMGSMQEWITDGEEVADEKKKGRRRSLLKRATDEETAEKNKRVIVVHCKAGKGRSGSMAVSYLLTHGGWLRDDALQRFTERRMRPGFGPGVSIPSQLRWIDYVIEWSKHGKRYVDRRVEVKEVHIWGMREGVKVAVEGYVENGKRIKTCHMFEKSERDDIGESLVTNESANGVVEAGKDMKNNQGDKKDAKTNGEDKSPALLNVVSEVVKSQRRSLSIRRSGSKRKSREPSRAGSLRDPGTPSESQSDGASDSKAIDSPPTATPVDAKPPSSQTLPVGYGATTVPPATNPSSLDKSSTNPSEKSKDPVTTTNTIYRPKHSIIVPTSDINLAVERRAHASYGWAMVTSVAHVWFNVFFEGGGPARLAEGKEPEDSGVFEITWDEMDGIKGSSRKGARALDKVGIVWQVVPDSGPDVARVDADEAEETRQEPTQTIEEEAGEKQKVEDERDSFESAREALSPTTTKPETIEPHSKSEQPAHWEGDRVRSPERHGSHGDETPISPMARRLGPRPADEAAKDVEIDQSTDSWRHERERQTGEEMPELDESSDEDGTEGIRRGVRLTDRSHAMKMPKRQSTG